MKCPAEVYFCYLSISPLQLHYNPVSVGSREDTLTRQPQRSRGSVQLKTDADFMSALQNMSLQQLATIDHCIRLSPPSFNLSLIFFCLYALNPPFEMPIPFFLEPSL